MRSSLAALLLAAVLAAPAFAEDATVTLARDGRATATIVLGDAAPPCCREAAEDLQAYLGRITGAEFPLVREAELKDAAGTLIVVGAGQLAAAAGIDPAKLEPEGFRIKTTAGRLFIVGVDRPEKWGDRGTWHGVCDFLESDLGVRWLWPGELGTIVPRRRELAIGPIDRTGAPAIHQRRVRDAMSNRNPTKLGRGMEILELDDQTHRRLIAQSDEWTSHQRLGSNSVAQYGHAFGDWWERYGDEHPEFFAMAPDGSRRPSYPDRAKLCVSNPAVAEQWMGNARQFFAAHPESISFSASANDSVYLGNCVCPECEALDDPRGEKYLMNWVCGDQKVEREHVSLSDRYVYFYNELAEKLAREFPDKLVGGYAYGSWKNPPLRETGLRPNVMIGYVGFSDLYVCEASRRRDLEQWDQWAKLAGRLFYRPNLLHTGYGMPLVYVHKLGRDLRHRHETGMIGCDFDSLVHHWATQGVNYYVLAKLLWDPAADVDALQDDYCRQGFGPAAEEVKAYFLAVERHSDRIAADFVSDPQDRYKFLATLPELYSEEVLAEWQAQLRGALGQVPGDSIYAKRIRWLGLGLEYASLQVQAATQARPKEITPEQRATLRQTCEEREQWYRHHLADWSVFGPLLVWRQPKSLLGPR